MLFYHAIIASLMALSAAARREVVKKAVTQDRYVFAHFMLGFVNGYSQSDWAADIKQAHSQGIDGFALNADGNEQNPTQLTRAYSAAAAFNSVLPSGQTPFQLFISPDFVHYSPTDPAPVASLLKNYVNLPAQFMYDGKAFVSSFWGQGTDWASVKSSVGSDLYVVPYYYASAAAADDAGVDGLFSWYTWPGQDSTNGAGHIKANITTDTDVNYLNLLKEANNKTYMMPISPWFYTHMPESTGWGKNYHLYSDTLLPTRLQQILDLATAYPDQAKFMEIITWNDWTESSLVSTYKGGDNAADGNQLWSKNDPHEGFMSLMAPYLRAFKSSQSQVTVNPDEVGLVYWYRPTLKSVSCDSTDTCGGKPTGWDLPDDSVFVSTLTTTTGTLTVQSGSHTYTQDIPGAGVHTFNFPMGVGAQSFTINTGGGSATVAGSTAISDECINGVYDWNALSGTVKVTNAVAGPAAPASSSKAVVSSSNTAAVTPSSNAPIVSSAKSPVSSVKASVPSSSNEAVIISSATSKASTQTTRTRYHTTTIAAVQTSTNAGVNLAAAGQQSDISPAPSASASANAEAGEASASSTTRGHPGGHGHGDRACKS